MSGGLVDKVYIGLDNAPVAFDIKGRILGPNGTNLEYIRSETGVVAVLKSDKYEPMHLALHHSRSEAITAAKSLALNLIETIKAELVQWSAAQGGGAGAPTMSVPPPTLAAGAATGTAATPPAPAAVAAATPPATAAPAAPPPPAAAPPLVTTVRPPTVLQFLPQQQQQYVLNQDNGQLIPIVQPGMQVSNQLSSLPLAQQLGGLQPHNFGTQFVDISGQPVNVTQLRLSGVPSSMSMILPNGLTFPQGQINTGDNTTVSTATPTPVVCAAQGTNGSQKIFYSTDKDKMEVKYIQGGDGVQWAMPGSQTMLIPYQQLQDLTANHGLTNIQPQQFVSIAPAGGLQQTSLPLTAAQLQQLQATGTIMHLNQKNPTPAKSINQEQRGQKRLSDGSPSQLQLRPIAPAGSQVTQDKSASRDARSWTATAGRENNVVSMGMKLNPAHGTIIHVSSGQQTSVSSGSVTSDGMYIRQIDRNSIQLQPAKDALKQDLNKLQTQQNVQMITVPPGMTVLQNPLNLGQMPVLGQHNSQVYMIPTNQHNLVQGGLPPGLIGPQVLQPGQNVTVMQSNQLGMQNSVQYNVPIMPMNVQNQQFLSGINLNNLSAQQLNAALAGQQLNQNLQVSGTIPIVQAPTQCAPITNQIAVSQAQTVQQIVPQNSFMAPTSQYATLPPQYVMQPNTPTLQNNPNIQYSIQQPNQQQAPPSNNPPPTNNTESEPTTPNPANNQNNYITSSQENSYAAPNQQPVQSAAPNSYPQDTATPQPPNYQNGNQNGNTPNYPSPAGTNGQSYSVPTTQAPPPSYSNGSTPQNYPPAPQGGVQTVPQTNFSPSSTPAPNQQYPNMAGYPNQQNSYPNGQNMYPNQYQYSMQQTPSRPWFRPPRYSGPGSPYNGPPAPNPAQPVPPPPAATAAANYNYWQDS